MSLIDRDGPVGIGGWLLLFLALIGLVAPLLTFIAVWASHGAGLTEYLGPTRMRALVALDWTLFAVRVLLSWYVVGRMVFVRRWQSVRIAIAYLWLALPLLLLLQAALGHALNWVEFGESLAYSIVQANPLLWAATAILWSLYLLRSKRVARTYVRPGLAAATVADTVRVFD